MKKSLKTFEEETYQNRKIFRYKYANKDGKELYVNLTVIRPAYVFGYTNLYLCHLSYSHSRIIEDDMEDLGALIGLSEVIISFDKDRLYNDPNYEEFMMKRVLNKDRINLLYDVEYNDAPGNKLGNYIGTIVEENGCLHVILDNELGEIVASSDISKNLHKMFDYYMGLSNNKPNKDVPRKKFLIVKNSVDNK
jgi:hypothetical protein